MCPHDNWLYVHYNRTVSYMLFQKKTPTTLFLFMSAQLMALFVTKKVNTHVLNIFNLQIIHAFHIHVFNILTRNTVKLCRYMYRKYGYISNIHSNITSRNIGCTKWMETYSPYVPVSLHLCWLLSCSVPY